MPAVKRPVFLLLSVLLLAGGGLGLALARQRTSAREAAPAPEDREDKAIIDFVLDEMVPRAAIAGAKACALPSRDFVGVLRVKTADGGIVFSKLDANALPTGWKEETSACIDGAFVGYQQRPAGLQVPPGREYEVDVQITFPLVGPQ
jgi:hypothetical protein